MIIKAFVTGIYQRMKYEEYSLKEAIEYELDMAFNVMGFKLYVKYMNGIAKEGIDFTTVE